MTQPDDISKVVREMREHIAERSVLEGYINLSTADEWADRIESLTPTPAEARGEVQPADEIAAWLARESKAGWSGDFGANLGNAADTISTLARQLAEAMTECSLLTHKVITCGVAARHPDPNLSRTGAYAGEWNSQQAEDVRALRDRAEQAEAQLAEAKAELHKRTDSVIVASGVALACSVAVKEAFDLQQAQLAQATARLAAVEGLAGKWRDDANIDASLGADHMAEATRNCADELDAALQPKEPQT